MSLLSLLSFPLFFSLLFYSPLHSTPLLSPLLFIFKGLKILSDDLERSNDEADKDRYDILSDVKSACRTSIEILNDLLCFDKLESGMLELNKHDVKILSFLTDSVNMFTSQAKELGVSLSIMLGEINDPNATRVLDTDTISMDKFKMDQVMRNLLSNALKFTPKKGSIIVRASFIRKEGSMLNAHDIALKTSSTLSCSYILSIFYGFYCFCSGKLRRKVHLVEEDDVEMQAKSGQSGLQDENDYHGGGRCNTRSHMSPKPKHCTDTHVNVTQEEDTSYKGGGRRGPALQLSRGESTMGNANNDSMYKSCFNRYVRSDGEKSEKRILSWMASKSEKANHSKNSYHNSKIDPDAIIHGILRISVTDTGAGLTQENIRRLFNEVVQFNPEILQSGGGSGLGLWITNSIVKMHSGIVCAQSAGLGKGCSFTIEVDMQRRGAPSFKTSSQPHEVHNIII